MYIQKNREKSKNIQEGARPGAAFIFIYREITKLWFDGVFVIYSAFLRVSPCNSVGFLGYGNCAYHWF
jgi:hypothetical protein